MFLTDGLPGLPADALDDVPVADVPVAEEKPPRFPQIVVSGERDDDAGSFLTRIGKLIWALDSAAASELDEERQAWTATDPARGGRDDDTWWQSKLDIARKWVTVR